MNRRLSILVGSTAGMLPVRVRGGVAKGARWTLFPWSSYWRGTHEPAVQEAVQSLGGGNIVGWSCWDLGAHFGIYSVGLAMRVGPAGQVLAFEPNPASFARLERHRRMNRLGCLKTFEAAASDRAGVSNLMTYGDLGSTSTHLPYQGEILGDSNGAIPVRTLRIDDVVESEGLRDPGFVKIDVEGHGHKALEGMSRSVAKARPILIIAFHSDEEVEGVMAILRPLGYQWSRTGAPAETDTLIAGDYLFVPRRAR